MIRLRTLGALDLRATDGQELRVVLAQPKRAALLAYLALTTLRGPRRRDTLLGLFWPEHDTEHARNALSQAIHFLRRSLGADVLVNRNGEEVGLDRAALWCDAVAFEEALDAGRVADAVDLYRGELLEGCHLAGAPEFDRWLEAERARLAGRYACAVEAAAADREAVGDFAGSVTYWRRLAARDPYSSRNALGLMRAMAAAGDPAGAVRHARVHETLLNEELALAPDAELLTLVRHLKAAPAEDQRLTSRTAPPDESGTSDDSTPRDVGMPPTTADEGELSPIPRSAPAPGATSDGPSLRRHEWRRRLILSGVVALSAAGAGAVISNQAGVWASTPPVRSLAVLPFDNLSRDSAQQEFAVGMHDALIAELSRYPELRVTSRTSVLQYQGTRKSLPEIARELKVDALVEGTLLWEGGRVRMNAQLVHGPSDQHIWTESYTRDRRDVLSLQGELAAAIARAVRVAATPATSVEHKETGPRDSAPNELYLRSLYLRGRHAEIGRSVVGLQTAIAYFRSAIERDSTFALAYAGLSEAYSLQAHYDLAPRRAALDSARVAALRAVALDSTRAETHTVLGLSLADAGQFEAAEPEFKRAIELGPSNSGAHYFYGMLLVALGRGAEALAEAERTLDLDPLAPQPALMTKRAALYLMTGERPDLEQPVEERRPMLRVEPGAPWPVGREAVELAEEGRCREAREKIAVGRRMVPDDNGVMLTNVADVFWLCGERARARAVLAEMKRHPDAFSNGDGIARLHARFGEKDSAFVWLGRHQWVLGELVLLRGDRFLDPLRSDPRFDELLLRIGLRPRATAAVATPR